MRRNQVLEDRLIEWGKEYGGGKYGRFGGGGSWLASMVRWGGRAPTGIGQVQLNTAADEVEFAVNELERQETGFVPATVLRCEYLTPGQPVEMKLQRVAEVSERFGRSKYYERLRVARKFVAEKLKIPYDDQASEQSSSSTG